jgi:hypothetical protein
MAARQQSASAVNNPFRQQSVTETTYGTTGTRDEDELRRDSSESEREGAGTIREVQERLRSASTTSSANRASGIQQVKRTTTGDMLFGGESGGVK